MYIYDEKKYIFDITVDLSSFFEEGVYITLREPNTTEMLKIKAALADKIDDKEEGYFRLYEQLLPNVITDHNFYVDEKTKIDNKSLTAILFSRISVIGLIMRKYNEEIIFLSTRGKKET
jgi:hypothetical protein